MANVFAIYSVGESIADYLAKTYPVELSGTHPCQFRAVSSVELNKTDTFTSTSVSLFCYRVTVNEFLRNQSRAAGTSESQTPLSLDLHYLLTIWADDHLTEQLVLGWTMKALYQRQMLTASDLSPDGGWAAGDFIQLIPEEMPTADMMRIWDALESKYRVSVSYVARAVRIDDESHSLGKPVVARRDQYAKLEQGR